MALAVVSVASGGIPVVIANALGGPNIGLPVTEAANGRGIAVTRVSLGPPMIPPAMPVIFVSP